jgi:anti-anti-sigma regulatory factor
MSSDKLRFPALRVTARRRTWGRQQHAGAMAHLKPSTHRGTLLIELQGKLNLQLARKLEKLCAVKKRRYQTYALDFSRITAIDDDGVCFLMFFPQLAAWFGAHVQFLNCHPAIKDTCAWAADVSGRDVLVTTAKGQALIPKP